MKRPGGVWGILVFHAHLAEKIMSWNRDISFTPLRTGIPFAKRKSEKRAGWQQRNGLPVAHIMNCGIENS
jgi:hypothetical protein